MGSWSTCPACWCLTTDPTEHARVCWPMNAKIGGMDHSRWWPDGIAPDEAAAGVALRAQAQEALAAYATLLPLLDDYLEATIDVPPDERALVGQVRVLTIGMRGIALAMRGMVRLVARASLMNGEGTTR